MKGAKLKERDKPNDNQPGLIDIYQSPIRFDRDKLERNLLDNGIRYKELPLKYREAPFKLHINLNNISDLSEEEIQGLIAFLVNESENPESASFNFKIFNPLKMHSPNHPRFKDHA